MSSQCNEKDLKKVKAKVKTASKDKTSEISFDNSGLTELGDEIYALLVPFSKVVLSSNKITRVAQGIGKLVNLTQLSLDKNQVTSLPPDLFSCPKLSSLNASDNLLPMLPEIPPISSSCLTSLDLSGNSFPSFPNQLCKLPALFTVDLSRNSITNILAACSCRSLTRLVLARNNLRELPPQISDLAKLTVLDLSSNWLSKLPAQFFALPSLEVLNVAGNVLGTLPEEMFKMPALTDLDVSGNGLAALPPSVGELLPLRQLKLRGNKLKFVPRELGNLQLEVLDLADNLLGDLPCELCNLDTLKTLTVTGNKFSNPELEAVVNKGSMPALLAFLKKSEEQSYIEGLGGRSSAVVVVTGGGAVNNRRVKGTQSSTRRAGVADLFGGISPPSSSGSTPSASPPLPAGATTTPPRSLVTSAGGSSSNLASSPRSATGSSRPLATSSPCLPGLMTHSAPAAIIDGFDPDHGLAAILKDPLGFQSFREFLSDEHSEENLIFWGDVERYKAIDDNTTRTAEARRLYEKYINESGAKFEVNIPYTQKIALKKEVMEIPAGQHPSKQCYDSAQVSIFGLMASDCFPRFTQSHYYKILSGLMTSPARTLSTN